MPVRSITTLKSWFQRGMYPLASQFADWMDSYWHKEDAIPLTSVDELPEHLNAKYNAADGQQLETRVEAYETALDEHKTDDAAEIEKIYKTFEELDDDIERVDKRVADETARLDNQKVDKIDGKGLSTEDFTTADKTRLDNTVTLDGTQTISGRKVFTGEIAFVENIDLNPELEYFLGIRAFNQGGDVCYVPNFGVPAAINVYTKDESVGSSSIRNIAGPMTADEYAALTPDASTLYIITD